MRSDQRSRAVLPDAPRLQRILVLLADGEHRELLLVLAEEPADARTLADRTSKPAALLRRGLLRLARGGLLASSVVAGRRVYQLADGVAVERRAGRLTVRVVTPAGSTLDLRMPHRSRARGRA